MPRPYLSKIAYFLCVALMLYTAYIDCPRYKAKGTQAAIAWDVAGYYLYLPSIFVYGDLKQQEFKKEIQEKYFPAPDFAGGMKAENGNFVNKYSAGMAVMYLPFFAIAHVLAEPLGYPTDGFSLPYQFAIFTGGVLVALLGLWYFRKLLLYYFKDRTVAVVLLLLVFGTSYLMYSTGNGTLSHTWLFTLYVFLILNTRKFYQNNFSYKYAIRIGLIIGLQVLTRPTEAIACLIPLLWGLDRIKWQAIKERFNLYLQHWKPLLLAAILAFAVVSIQLIYWKYVSGHWIVYSYEDQGFSWLHPHFADYMFSFKSGWLIYTPMMFLAFIGLIPLIIRYRNRVVIIAFFAINLYIVSAWDIWWYAGTGGRAMVQSYPILFFPIAALCEAAFYKKWSTIAIVPVLLVFIYANFWLTFSELYEPENMTNHFYWKTIYRWGTVPQQLHKLKDTNELYEGDPKNMRLLYSNDFEGDTTIYNFLKPIAGKISEYVGPDKPSTKQYTFSVREMNENADWVRVQATFFCEDKEWDPWRMTQMIVSLKTGDSTVKERILRMHRYLHDSEIKDLYLDVRLPDKQIDSIGIRMWNANNDKRLRMDNVKVWAFEE